MNTHSPQNQQTSERFYDSVFNDLRQRLSQEAPATRLADLIESVNAMQRAREMPEEFGLRFEEFVYRAEDYLHIVRPYFPALVAFLPAYRLANSFDAAVAEQSQRQVGAPKVA